MAAQTRSFTVFKDEPEGIPVQVDSRNIASEDGALGVLASPTKASNVITLTVPPPSGPLLVFCPDKENIDPSTGDRVLSEHGLCKKRKTALAVKAQPVSPSKKPRPLAEKPTKKPTSSKSRSSTDKKVKAKRSTSTSSKRNSSSRTRREPSLPRLAEECDEAASLDQVAIDAKCKELTVLPLADISEAYEQVAPKEDVESAGKAAEEKATVQAASEKIDRPVTPPPATHRAQGASAPVSTVSVFSTPEPKRVHSAFTFSSPSPASQRYASTRGSSVDRFSDAVF